VVFSTRIQPRDAKVRYHDDRDRLHWLELLGEMTASYGVRIHAYVSMSNHYHLLLQTPRANLSRAMQWLNVSFSIWFNKRHRRVGHLFQGRFKAIVVNPDEWALGLSRYVHLNPVRLGRLGLDKASQKLIRAGLGGKPEAEVVRERMRELRGYRWSSYRAYAGLANPASWLVWEWVLGRMAGGTGRRARAAYRAYVEEAVREGLDETPWEQLQAGVALGGTEFVGRIRSRLRGDPKEQPGLRELQGAPRFERVKAVVEQLKGDRWENFRDRRGDWGRDLALYMGRKRCGLKLAELGAAAGGIGYNSAGMAVRRFAAGLRQNRDLRQWLEKAEAALCNVQM
jgi:REP element-mobilizing transposase RayT